MRITIANRAGGAIIGNKRYWWTNWFVDELSIGEGMCKIPDFAMDFDLLEEMFDDKTSSYLMPIPLSWRRN